ncbi:MAG TPA: iron chelate uptake ABC transporter family permease subunit, partial [Bacillota bacterium]|nr:iron chelate uptake ABC transporter family permease subunit [Bacillota bacterium]
VFVVLGFYLRKLDVVALGRDHAINLGVDYDKLVQKMLVLVSVLVSVSTGLVGPITFLGLMVVNVARQVLKKVKHGSLLLASSLLGVVALIGGQLLVERVLNFAAPISVLINFVGGTYFIYLMLREKST